MDFQLIGPITNIQTIAQGGGIRDKARLQAKYPTGKNWKKKKGIAKVLLVASGVSVLAEVHWYEAHGVGKVEMKIKHII